MDLRFVFVFSFSSFLHKLIDPSSPLTQTDIRVDKVSEFGTRVLKQREKERVQVNKEELKSEVNPKQEMFPFYRSEVYGVRVQEVSLEASSLLEGLIEVSFSGPLLRRTGFDTEINDLDLTYGTGTQDPFHLRVRPVKESPSRQEVSFYTPTMTFPSSLSIFVQIVR